MLNLKIKKQIKENRKYFHKKNFMYWGFNIGRLSNWRGYWEIT